MQSHYRINVSHKGQHLFNTGDTLTAPDEARTVYDIFKVKFPKKDGYELSVIKWEIVGTFLDWE